MNWLDITILILCIVGLVKGFYDGMIKQVVAVIALIIGIYLCSGVAKWLFAYLIQLEWFPQNVVLWFSYLIGFVLIVGIILTAGGIVHRLVSATPLSIFNHFIGGLAGFILMILIISVLFNLIELVDPLSSIITKDIKEESRFYTTIKRIIEDLFPGNLFDLEKKLFT